jgi:hypothetical protein
MQPSLFSDRRVEKVKDVTAGKHGGNAESQAAFETIKKTLKESQRQVLEVVRRLGTATTEEVAIAMNKPVHSISGRMAENKRDGLIEATGEKRLTRSNIKAAVFRAVEK